MKAPLSIDNTGAINMCATPFGPSHATMQSYNHYKHDSSANPVFDGKQHEDCCI